MEQLDVELSSQPTIKPNQILSMVPSQLIDCRQQQLGGKHSCKNLQDYKSDCKHCEQWCVQKLIELSNIKPHIDIHLHTAPADITKRLIVAHMEIE